MILSIIMTSYNRENLIATSIESVLNSTFNNFELLIVDDCSTDRTVEIAKSYEKKDKRVKIVVNSKNLGDYPNRNRALKIACAEYIMFVDSDDILYPQSVESIMRFMIPHPEIQFGIGTPGALNFNSPPRIYNSEEMIISHFFIQPKLVVGPGGMIAKKTFYNLIGGFPTKYGPANDMYFSLIAASKAAVVVFPFEFVFYRRHEGQQINNYFGYLFNNYCYLRDALKELDLPLSTSQKKWIELKNKRRFSVNIIKYFLKTFNFSKTFKAIHLAKFSLKDAMQGVFH